jgi:hypothetical protein
MRCVLVFSIPANVLLGVRLQSFMGLERESPPIQHGYTECISLRQMRYAFRKTLLGTDIKPNFASKVG